MPDPTPDHAHSLLAAIVASSNDAIIGKDLDGLVTSWNEAAERLFGFAAAEIIGQSIALIIPPDRIGEEASILGRVAQGDSLSHFETVRRAKDGHEIAVSLTISPIRDDAGRVVGISKTARDLSGIHRSDRELLSREAVLQSILDTVPDGLIVMDHSGCVQSFSPAAERMFGYAAAQMIGRNVSLLMPQAHAAAHDGYLGRYLATGERRIIGIGRVVTGRRQDGTIFPVELQIGEVLVPGTHLFTGFVRDLTARHDRERRFAELQTELIHVSRLSELGQMVSVLAHEVSQPLTAISNYAGGVRRLLQAGSPPALGQAVGKIIEQAERAHKIVQSLRGLVRKEPQPRRTEDLAMLIQEMGALALAGAGRSVGLDLHIAADATHAFVDKVQVQQVLLNLMRNSVEAMEGAAARVLTVTTAKRDDRVEIRVSDTGPGLSSLVQPRLFQPFVTTKASGLGVGLSICRSIVEAHGGVLAGENNLDCGAVFRFTVPGPARPNDLDQRQATTTVPKASYHRQSPEQ